MQIVKFKDAKSCEPEPGWYRVSLAARESVSVEYFKKPPKHSSPMHEHKNKQIMVVVKGKMKVYTQDEEAVLGEMDSVFFDENEPHKVENALEEKSVGIEIFVPGRSFDFWLKRLAESKKLRE